MFEIIGVISKAIADGDALWKFHDKVFLFVRDHTILATIGVSVLIAIGIYLSIKSAVAFAADIAQFWARDFGKLYTVAGTIAIVLVAYSVVSVINFASRPVPILTRTAVSPIGVPVILSWQYKAPVDSGHLLYKLQSSALVTFESNVEDVSLQPRDSFTKPDPLNGKKFFRVRAVKDDVNRTPVSAWSNALEVEQYEDSIARIQATNQIVVGISDSSEQGVFKYSNRDGQHSGFDINLAREIVTRMTKMPEMKMQNVDLKFREFPWLELLAAPGAGKADFIISSITTIPEREEESGIKFTSPYYCTTQSVVYSKGRSVGALKDELKGKKVAVPKGTTSADLANALREQIGGATAFRIEPLRESEEILNSLFGGSNRNDFGFMDTPFAYSAVLRRRDSHGPVLAHREITKADLPPGRSELEHYAIAVRGRETGLLDSINTAISALRADGKLDELFRSSFNEFVRIKPDETNLGNMVPSRCPRQSSAMLQ